MKTTIFFLPILYSSLAFCQHSKANEIDSALATDRGFYNYRFEWSCGKSFFDFKMDTTTGRPTSATYLLKDRDSVFIEYIFLDNYLVKARSSYVRQNKLIPAGTYYFTDNKLVFKVGKNINLGGKGIFSKVRPGYFKKQLKYIYSQFEYLNSSKTRSQFNVPDLWR